MPRWRIIPVLVLTLASCLSCQTTTRTGPQPDAALGETGSSQLEFRQLSHAWHAATPERRNQLDAPLREFLQKYPRDELRRPASAYLAWILIQKGEVLEARDRIRFVKGGPSGAAQDFASVAEAALLTHHGQSREAVKLLRPLQGKIIDPVERFLATQQLVLAALEAEFYGEALLYFVDWAHQAAEHDRLRVREAIESQLRRIPTRYLEPALARLEAKSDDNDRRADSPLLESQRQWLYGAISARLTSHALDTQDVGLAQRVVARNPELVRHRDNSEELVRLASGGEVNASISGRTVGLLLSTSTQQGRRHSREVATGLAEALEPPNPERSPSGATRFEIVFAEDSGDNTEQALRSLTASGAALIIAGIDERSAVGAASYAARLRVPITLIEPIAARSEFVFSLGLSQVQQQAILLHGASAAEVADPLATITPNDCTLPDRAGAPQFPVQEWKSSGIRTILLMTGPDCAREVIRETDRFGFRPLFGLGLDAADITNDGSAAQLMFIAAGHFPNGSGPKDLEQFVSHRGRRPTWYEALGHDAGVVARAALSALPNFNSSDAREVARFHERVQVQLANIGVSRAAGLGLWTSKTASFDSNRALARSLRYVRGSP